jgi:hypothetical protein
MRYLILLSLVLLSGCIGYARGDGQGNVEVVTNFGRSGEIPDEETEPDETPN